MVVRHHVREHSRSGYGVRDYHRGSGSKVKKFFGVYKGPDPQRYAKRREYNENFEADYRAKVFEWMEKHNVYDSRDVPPEVKKEIRQKLAKDPRYVLFRAKLGLKP